jgi:hypothetical protein
MIRTWTTILVSENQRAAQDALALARGCALRQFETTLQRGPL